MEITVCFKNCSGCRHRDHSGAFTPGGAKEICGHPDVSDCVLETNKNTVYDDPNGANLDIDKQCYYWKNRIIEDFMDTNDEFPEFCPLKHGNRY